MYNEISMLYIHQTYYYSFHLPVSVWAQSDSSKYTSKPTWKVCFSLLPHSLWMNSSPLIKPNCSYLPARFPQTNYCPINNNVLPNMSSPSIIHNISLCYTGSIKVYSYILRKSFALSQFKPYIFRFSLNLTNCLVSL